MSSRLFLIYCVLLPVICLPSICYTQASYLSLNGQWDFRTDLYKKGEEQHWYDPETTTAGWDQMAVPGNWDLENEYADYAGTAWYRRAFPTVEAWKGKRVRLYFESVYNDSKVWLNGQLVAENKLGFLPFWVDVQDILKEEGDNILVVQADNTFKRGAIWNWGGIRRPVWLEITPMVRLERQHITAIPSLESGTAEISVELKASNTGSVPARLGYRWKVEKEGKVIFEEEKPLSFTIPAGEEIIHRLQFQLQKEEVHLWHFNHPHLYDSRLELLRNGEPVHQLSDRFGIRTIEVDGYNLKLNGEPIRTVGFNLVPEDRTTGNTLPLWRIKEDVDMMKALGANMARLSHLPLPKDLLDYLDERGIMVFEEVSLWGKDEMANPGHPSPKEWLERMVEWKYNHPSVIGWSIGNEIGYLNANPMVMEYVEGATAHARRLDPHRLAIYVSHSAHAQPADPVAFSDLILYNRYGNWGTDAEKVNELHPGKPIFMAEYGKELNHEDPNKASIDAAEMLNAMRGRPYLMGASLWTFNDYRSFWKAGPTWTTPPSQNRCWGVVNTFRQKKRPYYAFRKEYAPVQGLRLQEVSKAGKATAKIEPRGKLDIPAYTMRGYRLLWAGYSEQGKVLSGGFTPLPEIHPGDKALRLPIRWDTAKVVRLEVHLLGPQDYSVLDTVLHFQAPKAPQILSVHTAQHAARVVFQPADNATSYHLRYGKKGERPQLSPPTINDFVEVQGLEPFTDYRFEVIALNGAGENPTAEGITASTDEDELPPVIWTTVPADKSFFIGYSVDRQDYLFEIAYGTRPGQYTDTLALRNVGVCKIPGLENGRTYYYKIRRRMQWGFVSEWSHEIAVTPDGGTASGTTDIRGILSSEAQQIMLFEPVHKATGYRIERPGKQAIPITHTQSGFFTLPGSIRGSAEIRIMVE